MAAIHPLTLAMPQVKYIKQSPCNNNLQLLMTTDGNTAPISLMETDKPMSLGFFLKQVGLNRILHQHTQEPLTLQRTYFQYTREAYMQDLTEIKNEAISQVDFTGSFFECTDIENCIFNQCCFDSCLFQDSIITDTTFINCSFVGAAFEDEDYKTEDNFVDCRFDRCNFKEADLSAITFAPSTTLVKGNLYQNFLNSRCYFYPKDGTVWVRDDELHLSASADAYDALATAAIAKRGAVLDAQGQHYFTIRHDYIMSQFDLYRKLGMAGYFPLV